MEGGALMKEFMRPEMEIIKFQAEDIIAASGDTFEEDNTGEWT